MVVDEARASVEPVPPSMCKAKAGAKTVSPAGEIDLRLVQPSQWRRRHKHERLICPGEQKCRQSIYVARVCENRKNR